jgi:hypothetical protein
MDQQPIGNKNVIYLPSFNITNKTYLNYPKSFEEIKVEQNKKSYIVSKFSQNNQLAFTNDNRGCIINYPPSDEDIVIKKDFLMAIIHLEILCDLQIPVITAFIVRRNNFLNY